MASKESGRMTLKEKCLTIIVALVVFGVLWGVTITIFGGPPIRATPPPPAPPPPPQVTTTLHDAGDGVTCWVLRRGSEILGSGCLR